MQGRESDRKINANSIHRLHSLKATPAPDWSEPTTTRILTKASVDGRAGSGSKYSAEPTITCPGCPWQPRRSEPVLTTPTRLRRVDSRVSAKTGLPLNPPSVIPSTKCCPLRSILIRPSTSASVTRRSDTLITSMPMGKGSNRPKVSNAWRPCAGNPTMVAGSPTAARVGGHQSSGKYALLVAPAFRSRCGNSMVARSR